jgi:hypothetical protein
MSLLAQKYSTLSIISGTIATKKQYDTFNLEKYSKNIKKTDEAWESTLLKNSLLKKEWEKNRGKKMMGLAGEVGEFSSLWKSKKSKDKVVMMRNTCYAFQGKNIFQRDKVIPYSETTDLKNFSLSVLEDAAFRPGRGEAGNPLKLLTHPHTGKPIAIALEICIEHAAGYAKMMNQEVEIKPYIHFVLSDSVNIHEQHIDGECFIHVDSFFEPKILAHSSNANGINLYKLNVLDANDTLRNIVPKSADDLNIVECMEFLEACIYKLDKSPSLKEKFENIKKEFIEIHDDNPELFDQVWKQSGLRVLIREWHGSLYGMKPDMELLTKYKDNLSDLAFHYKNHKEEMLQEMKSMKNNSL